MRAALTLSAFLMLAGCADQTVDVYRGYTLAPITEQMPLTFQPGGTMLEPVSEAQIQRLRPRLPATGDLSLVADGPLAAERARSLTAVLRRPVLLQASGSRRLASDEALLLLTTERVVAASCLGAGQPNARNIWPGDDSDRPRFMPPGCTTENAIAAMTVRPSDLTQGRPLAPGAALPLARAVDRYYQEGDRRSLGLPGSPVDAGPGQNVPAATGPGFGGATAPAGDATAGAGLLQGPLTDSAGAAPAGVAPAAAAPGASTAQPAAR